MPSCQAFNCTNEKGKCKKSFFIIPDPTKSAEKRRICKQWITNLKNGKLRFETFKYNSSKVVCEDHFTAESFDRNLVAESLNFMPSKKRLLPNAVPTIVNTGTASSTKKRGQRRDSSSALQKKRKTAQMKDSLLKELNTIRHSATATASSSDVSQPNELQSTTYEDFTSDVSSCLADQTDLSKESSIQVFGDGTNDTAAQNCTSDQLVQSCGHPCVMCLQANAIDTSVLISDHHYCKSAPNFDQKVTKSIGINTDETMFDSVSCDSYNHANILSSTPIKTALNESFENIDDTLDISFRDDPKDKTFEIQPSDLEDSDNDSDCDSEDLIVSQRKFIVFESQLDQLFTRLKCNECSCSIDPSDIVKDSSCGSLLKVQIYCTNGHLVHHWFSQPMIGKMPAGNLLISAATLFCGQTYTHISQFSSHMNLNFIGKTTFYTIQREVLMPVIQHSWSLFQTKILERIKLLNRPLRLAGDGRCDSPGFSAKYCTYSLMDMETQQILTFVTIKVTDTGSSARMEVEGFRRCLEYLLSLGFVIQVLATDRHVQIRSLINKQYNTINHQFDVWHLAKSIRKKLEQKAKARGAEDLGPWIRSVCNHLWWCSTNCNGNKQWLEESFISIVHHCVNIHSFDGDLVKQCCHDDIPLEIAKKKKWLIKGSKAHNSLKEVVLDKRLRKDIQHLSECCHTGNLEVYHSLMTKYVPKRQEFDYDQMHARTTIAVIDHNLSQNRGQKVNADGQFVYRTAFSKATGRWAAKPVYNPKSYEWVTNMIKMCIIQKENMILPEIAVKKQGNIAPIPAPQKSELVQNLVSRFQKSVD